MSEGDGARLLYRASTGLEKALADLDGDRITKINAELIRDIWDPYKCPVDLLQYLAWAQGIEYWNDRWSETTKRTWIANQWLFKSRRGTESALRMAIDYAGRDISRWGYVLDKVTTRPQQVFSGPSLTIAEREDWLQKLPQVREWRIHEQGLAGKFKSFLNASNALRLRDRRFCFNSASPSPDIMTPVSVASTPSTAIQRLKRRVRWIEGGVETDVTVTEFGSYWRVHRSGVEDSKVFSGRCFGLGRFLIPSDAWKRLLTVQPDAKLPWRSAVTPTLQAMTSEAEIVKESHTPESGMRNWNVFSGRPASDGYFIPTTATYRIYNRYAVLDPEIKPLRRPAVQFMGVGRYGFPPFTAWADVRVGNVLSKWAAGFGYYQFRLKFWIPHDPTPIQDVRRAAVASKSLRDKILLRTGPKRRFMAAGAPILAGIDRVIVGRP